MAILKFKKGTDVNLSPHFNATEFDCPCTVCLDTTIDKDLVTKLEALREKAGPLKINSGYRCSNYQDELRLRGYETSNGPSQHELGRAADVCGADTGYTGTALETWAREAGFRAVGVGSLWVHVDLRDDKDRRWEYAKR